MKTKYVFLSVLASTVLMACSPASVEKEVKRDSQVPLVSAETVANNAPLPTDAKPSFSQETVSKLNGIVRHSLASIEEYDTSIDDIRKSVENASADVSDVKAYQTAMKDVQRLEALKRAAAQARSDMKAAKLELEQGTEFYNPVLLAGMVQFVDKVDAEISDEYTKLETQMAR